MKSAAKGVISGLLGSAAEPTTEIRRRMIVFIGTGLLIGGLLGTRFTVLAIIPAAALALGAAALAWVGQARAPDWGWLDLVALLVFMQIGYCCGAGLRLLRASRSGVRLGWIFRILR